MVGTCLQRQNIALRTYAAFEKTTCMLLKGEKNLLQNGVGKKPTFRKGLGTYKKLRNYNLKLNQFELIQVLKTKGNNKNAEAMPKLSGSLYIRSKVFLPLCEIFIDFGTGA